jgi:large subunit ribosomal protein L35Ae
MAAAAPASKPRRAPRVAPEPRLYINAIFTSFRRNKRNINPAQALLKIDGVNSKEEAQFYVGKKVAAPQKGKDTSLPPNTGTITQVHGNSGVVRAKFDHNLPPVFLGSEVRVYLYPSTI